MWVENFHIPERARCFIRELLKKKPSLSEANQSLASACGILDFFTDQAELAELAEFLSSDGDCVTEPDRAEYGDFQTNRELALRVTKHLQGNGSMPTLLLEPTFGKGNFILAALQTFPGLLRVVGFEIYRPYVLETKFEILDYYLKNDDRAKPVIQLFHRDVFSVEFRQLSKEMAGSEVLILGNPPWVTNAELGSLDSRNLPKKSNFKKLGGLDAITGKGNFDIAEFITLALLEAYKNHSGQLAFLVKNAVVKNIVFNQKKAALPISNMLQIPIDAKKEFGAAVEASLFYCQLNASPAYYCQVGSFSFEKSSGISFGWVGSHFVSNIEKYQSVLHIDGVCPFEWRQGLKHDCSSVMELERINGHFGNGQCQEITLENDLVYGLLKSSGLKGGVVSEPQKYTIVTQRKVGQETSYIEHLFPDTFAYLNTHRGQFEGRKSSIYRGKPPFSIFGIGDYAFRPFKVAISGLYKSATFTLLAPDNGKPLMLDDTCYFIGFDNLKDAAIAFGLLNSKLVNDFLKAIIFPDAKRVFTKDILMRIDLRKVAALADFKEIEGLLLKAGIEAQIQKSDILDFAHYQKPADQLQLF